MTLLATALTRTTGVKGTPKNADGAVTAVRAALERAGVTPDALHRVLLNEATPVISGLAMETITETIITESTMIGHNPATPGGTGIGVGVTVAIGDVLDGPEGPVVVVVPPGWDFDDVAATLNAAVDKGVDLTAAILAGDDAVLVTNRLTRKVPVVDEVAAVEKVPLGMLSAVEVAAPGRTIRTLSNSYGLATVFGLDPQQTRQVAPVARALTGNRSAVVVRTPTGDVTDRRIPVGELTLRGEARTVRVDVDAGAEAIMDALARAQPLVDATGEPGTHVGGMLAQVRDTMTDITGQPASEIAIRDVLAVDTMVPAEVRGGLAGEVALENAVALAAMVRTDRSRMQAVADRVADELGTSAAVGRDRGRDGRPGRAHHPRRRAAGRRPRPRRRLDRRGPARPRRRVRRHARRGGGRAGHQADRRRAGAGQPRDRRARQAPSAGQGGELLPPAPRGRHGPVRAGAAAAPGLRPGRDARRGRPLAGAHAAEPGRDPAGCGARPSGGCSS